VELLGREHTRLGEELLEPGHVLGRTIEQLHEASPPFGLECELRSIGQNTLGLDDRRIDDDVSQRPARRLRGLSDEPVRPRRNPEVPSFRGLRHEVTVLTPSVRISDSGGAAAPRSVEAVFHRRSRLPPIGAAVNEITEILRLVTATLALVRELVSGWRSRRR